MLDRSTNNLDVDRIVLNIEDRSSRSSGPCPAGRCGASAAWTCKRLTPAGFGDAGTWNPPIGRGVGCTCGYAGIGDHWRLLADAGSPRICEVAAGTTVWLFDGPNDYGSEDTSLRAIGAFAEMLGIHLLPIALPDSSVIVDDYYFAAARWPATARVAQSASGAEARERLATLVAGVSYAWCGRPRRV